MEPKNNEAMDENQWLDGLKEQAEAHTEAPPEEWWNDVQRRMDETMAASKRRRMLFVWIGSAAAAVIAGVVLLLNIDGDMSNPVSTVLPTISQKYTEPEPAIPESDPHPVHVPATDSNVHVKKADVESDLMANAESHPKAEDKSETDEKAPHTVPGTTPSESGNARQEKPTDDHPATVKERTLDNFETPPNTYIPKPKGKNWHTGLFASNISSANSNNGGFEPPGSIGSELIEYTDVKHHLPVTVGVTFSYSISERWSLSSGLMYTRLSSRLKADNNPNYYSRDQVLHNIGIPLNINYNLWRGDKLSVYLSAGGEVEKNVSGSSLFRFMSGGTIQTERRDKISDRLQWSVRGAAGLQYNFTKITGLYVEPGINYYFNNHSEIQTIYKSKPLNFGLRLGVRFSM